MINSFIGFDNTVEFQILNNLVKKRFFNSDYRDNYFKINFQKWRPVLNY